ncbi:MAG TPA: ABC transporter permease [Terriglobales bacterium]|nr:ABC transporter permease [Terriglobales bacterium]
METLLQDVRYGWRMLRNSPGFTLVAVVTLALGIGANTAMFSVINRVLLRSVPFPDSNRVMIVWKTMSNGSPNAFSTPAFLEWKQQGGFTEHLGAFTATGKNLSTNSLPERVAGGKANYDLFPILDVQPALGRMFLPEEDHPGAGSVVILSHALWKTRFGSRPDILGTSISLDGAPFVVVGVMPAGFHVLSDKELFWIPLQLESANAQASARNLHWLFGFIRLKPGIGQEQAQAILNGMAARLKAQDPTGEGGFGTTLQPMADFLYGDVKPVLYLLLGAVAFVLLIACSNVANLLLARGTMRRREISIRTALGAARIRMIRQFLTESILLSVVGGVVGIGLAWVALRVLRAIHPSSIPSVDAISIDGTVLAYTALLCGVVGVLFGVAPALDYSRVNVSEALKEGSRGSSGGLGKHRVMLVVTETALASILLIGAGLSLKSLWRTEKIDPGFNPSGVMTFRLASPAQFTGDRIPVFYQQVIDRLRAVPGVQSAVLARNLPMSGTDPSLAISIEGTPPPPSQIPIVTRLRVVGPDYFNGLQIAMLNGREFNEHDSAASPKVAIVSQSLAKLYWPNENALGKRLKPEMPGGEWCTVVGVASDVRHWAADITDVEPTAYYPYAQIPPSFLLLLEGNMSIAVRSQNSSGLLGSIRTAVGEIDSSVPLYDVKGMEEMVADSGSLRRFDMWLIGSFAGLALVLAGVGIYGVMAYSVAQRTREIGIRVALGASEGNVLQLILRQGAKLALAGVVVGLVGAFALTRLMQSLLFQVGARDVSTFTFVPPIALAMILLGCYIPARRATRLDPVDALREE